MDVDWVFHEIDGSKEEITLNEKRLPRGGDGKAHDGKGYQVRHVITGSLNNPVVIATP